MRRFSGTVRSVREASSGTWSTNYGIAVYDLSEVQVLANASSARHALTGGGGAVPLSEVGDGLTGFGAFGSHITIPGGVYTSYGQHPAPNGNLFGINAIDAHGNVLSLMMSDSCIVYGGVTSAARASRIRGHIYAGRY